MIITILWALQIIQFIKIRNHIKAKMEGNKKKFIKYNFKIYIKKCQIKAFR
jgi:hypothetical protein